MSAAASASAIERSVALLRERAGPRQPRIAVLLGTGWHGVADAVQDASDIAYGELPAFPELAIGGHAGRVRMGRLGSTEVMVLAGRKHAYEDGDASAMKGAVRTLAAFGVRILVQTNAAGSLDAAMPPGSLMLLSDHLNLPQRTPLSGETSDARFVNMTDAYDPALRGQALRALTARGQVLHEGVYAWAMGPQFETPAEIRMLGLLGARAVGMSTVPETILARHAGMRVLALSLITNLAAGLGAEPLSHAHTLHSAGNRADLTTQAMRVIVDAIAAPGGAPSPR